MNPPRSEIVDYVQSVRPGSRLEPLAGDASTRRFFRLIAPNGDTCIVMDYGRSFSGTTDDVRLTRLFRESRLPVAEVLAVAEAAGCLLLEDLGDRSLEDEMSGADDRRREWLERAVRLAAEIAERGTVALERSDRRDGPALDRERFRFEMDFFLEHAASERCAPSDELRRALHALADRAADSPRKVLCHRDYHSRNLMVRDDGSLAMVDIQDARWGPDTYDLASILRDAYVDIDETWLEPLVRLYLSRRTAPAPFEEFHERFRTVAAQRMIKALGTFAYQRNVLGRDRYDTSSERTRARLRRDLPRDRDLAPLHALLLEHRLLNPTA